MQKALVQMNIQLTEVLTDVMGMTGQAIIRAIVAGERDPKALAKHRDRRVKASAEEIIKALTGNWRDEHLFVLRQALGMYADIAKHLADVRQWVEGDAVWQRLTGLEFWFTPPAGTVVPQPSRSRMVLLMTAVVFILVLLIGALVNA